MDLLQTTILGLIQGVTEWLPISSTGHLRLTEHFFNIRVPILFDAILHAGTLIVILLFFRKDIKNILAALAKLSFKTENGKLIPLIIVGTIPTALIGVFLGNAIEALFSDLLPIAGAFVICGAVLCSSKIVTESKAQHKSLGSAGNRHSPRHSNNSRAIAKRFDNRRGAFTWVETREGLQVFLPAFNPGYDRRVRLNLLLPA